MLFGKHINLLLKDFYENNKTIVIGSVMGSVITFTIESIVTPYVMGKLFTNLNDKIILRNNIIKLLGTCILTQTAYAISEKLNSQLEPVLTKYITDKIIDNIFIKYDITHKEIDMSIIFSKIYLLRTNIESLIDRLFMILLPRFISILIIGIRFLLINKKLGVCFISIILLQFSFMFNNINVCINKSYNELEVRDEVMEYIEDRFNNIHTISSTMNGIEKEMNNCKNKSEEIMNLRLDSCKCIINKQINGYISNTIVFTVILLYSYKLYNENELSTEDITSILITMNSLFNHMYEITYYIPEIIDKFGILDNNNKFIEELFSYKQVHGEDIEIKNGIIEFNNVSFSYDDNNKIFNNFNKIINDNKIVAIYGQSGSGKSTFVKLICNILQPNSGIIYIDGNDIKNLSKNTIKKYITYISQNTSSLFNDTIYNNIIYGMDYYSDNLETEVKNIIKKYNLNNIFMNLNDKLNNKNEYDFLNYNVGKNGELLSGGQRQIIHIIRAMLNKISKILILDEPTSAIDNDNRNNILNMIKEEAKNRLVLIITHDNQIKNRCDEYIQIK